ncbi:MAG: hypothetical protein IT347_01785 [Candidatus Eisenbacteria bacterium]|nr:hypothetical protein [Candidatus Eisenbacteria bacterium]
MTANFRRLRPLLAAATLLTVVLLARGPAGAPQASAACADTLLVRTVKRYSLSSGSQVTHIDTCTAIAVPGRRFLLEVLRPSTSNPLDSARVTYGGVEYFGTHDVDASNVLLSRTITPKGTATLKVTLYGSAGAKLDLRITQVPEPLFQVASQSGLSGASSSADKWYTRYFSIADGVPASPHVMVLTNGNVDSTGNARTLESEVWLNSSQIIFPGEVTRGRAFISRSVTLEDDNTLEVKLQGQQSGKTMSVKFYGTDVTAPDLAVFAPTDSLVTQAAKVLASVQLADTQTGTRLWVDGAEKTLTSGAWSDSVALPAPDGKTTLTFVGMNGACLTDTVRRTVIRDTQAPTLEVTYPATELATVDTTLDTLVVTGYWIDSTVTRVEVDGDQVAVGDSGHFQAHVPLDIGPNRILVRATDVLGHVTSLWRYVNRVPTNESALSEVVDAPELPSTEATTFLDATKFLYTGASPLQTGATASTFDTARVAVLRGKVFARDIGPLPNVAVSVLGHSEYGQTLTREDGRFDLAVNGGGVVTLRFLKAGYLEAQRNLQVATNDYVVLDSLALIGRSSRRYAISLAADTVFDTRFESDENGDRRLALMFRSGTGAKVIRAPGDTVTLESSVSVRAKEYTVGDGGLESMPAALPPSTAYTYCVSLSLDEAEALAPAGDPSPETRFSTPVACYVRDFLHLPLGTTIPSGYYDRTKGQWEAGEDGVVLRIVDVVNGLASVDADTVAGADDADSLLALGIDEAERARLAQQYAPGDTLWRVRVDRFSTWDFNLNLAWLAYSSSPAAQRARRILGLVPCSTVRKGSIIECENRVLGERIPLAGSPYSLNYRSYRMPGDAAMRKLRIPLYGDSLPSQVRKVHVVVDVAGQRLTQVLTPPLASTFTTVVWNGLDDYNRAVRGAVTARVGVGYEYGAAYAMTVRGGGGSMDDAGTSGGGAAVATGNRDEDRISWSRQNVSIGAPGTGSASLGGWTLSAHHFYDPAGSGAIYYGDGDLRSGDSMYPMIDRIAGNGQSYNNTINEANPAVSEEISPRDLATGPDGLLYILIGKFASSGGRVYKLRSDGKLQLVAGDGGTNYDPDDEGKAAVDVSLNDPNSIAFGPDGSLYILDTDTYGSFNYQQRVRRVDLAGHITTVVGDGHAVTSGGYGDGGPALAARLCDPRGLAVGPNGAIYIGEASGSRRVRRVGTNGIIRTFAGTGQLSTQDLEGRATTVGLRDIWDVVVDRDGVLYVADGERVKKVTPDGQLTNVTGTSVNFRPYSLTVAPDGGLLIVSSAPEARLYRRDADGTMVPVAGIGASGTRVWSEIVPAAGAPLHISIGRGVAVGGDGGIWVGEDNVVSRIATILPTKTLGEFMVPSEDGRESYVFSSRGRHLRTVDAMTGADLLTFMYDGQGRLWKLTDADNNQTVITRPSASLTVICGPFGVCDSLYLEDGLLSRVANPNGEGVRLLYNDPDSGLLTDFYDAKDQRHWFEYDNEGRLDKDHDPASGVQTLTASEAGPTRTVEVETALGRTTTYVARQSFDGYFRKSVEDPSGFKSFYVDTVDDRGQWIAGVSSAGDSVRGRPRPEPRFGMFAPIDTGMTVVLPNGLKHRIGLTRPYSRTSFDPPGATGGTWQENVSINSNGTWQTTFALSAGTGTWQTTSPEGRSVTTTVDESGRPLTVAIPGLSTVTLGYDAAGRLEDVTQGARLWHYDYDDSGRVFRAISPKPDTVLFGYDAAGRLLRQDLPGGRVVGFGYDANGNVTALRPPGSELHEFDYSGVDQTTLYRAPDTGSGDRETQYGYNFDHQLETITQPGDVTVELDYDAGGRLWHVTQPRGTSTLAYSPSTGQLASLTSADSLTTVAFGYNGSLPTSETWSGAVEGNVALDWNPDLQPRLQTVTAGGSTDTAGFAYDRDGLLRRAGALGVFPRSTNGLPDSTQAGVVVSRQDYDGYGDLVNLRYRTGASVLLQQSVQRDALGRIEQLDDVAVDSSRTWEYGYDIAGRLEQVWRSGLLVQRIWYDANGNPDSVQGPGGAGDRITTDVDAQDRLLRLGDTGYMYTLNGELSMKVAGTDTTRYTYDALGNLVTVVLPSGQRIDYLIDGRNRRVARKIDGVMERQWLYENGVSPVAELDGDGKLLWRFVYGTRAHVPDLAMRGDTAYRVVSDHLGSVRALVRASDGAVRAWWNYDAWGNVLTSSGPGPCLGFAGGLTDSLTGLVRFGARDYDPVAGRWTAKDPIGFAGNDDNMYAYSANDPLDWADPSGTDAIIVNYVGYPIHVGPTVLPLGHAGVIAVDPATGHTEYYEFGRYNNSSGEVERRTIPDLKFHNGAPTQESLDALAKALSEGLGKGHPAQLDYRADTDYQAVLEYVRKRKANPPTWWWPGYTCKVFAREAGNAKKEKKQ